MPILQLSTLHSFDISFPHSLHSTPLLFTHNSSKTGVLRPTNTDSTHTTYTQIAKMAATTTPTSAAQASQQESQQEGRHLLVLNHGLWGNAGHVKFIADQFKERLGDRLLVVSISFLSPSC